jgi:hypothetical protein
VREMLCVVVGVGMLVVLVVVVVFVVYRPVPSNL